VHHHYLISNRSRSTARHGFAAISLRFHALQKVRYYTKIANDYQAAIDNVLWNEEEGIWFDYDIKNGKQRNSFYISNLVPLYTMSYDQDNKLNYALKAVSYLKRNRVDTFYGKHAPRSISLSTDIDIALALFLDASSSFRDRSLEILSSLPCVFHGFKAVSPRGTRESTKRRE